MEVRFYMSNDKNNQYPQNIPPHRRLPETIIQPKHHLTYGISTSYTGPVNSESDTKLTKTSNYIIPPRDSSFLIKDHNQHFIRDLNDPNRPNDKNLPVTYTDDQGRIVPVFSGTTTNFNPYNNPEMDSIAKNGIEDHETKRDKSLSGDKYLLPPTSPFHPFTRMNDPANARIATLTTYNRTKTPIADLEFRKSFRHVFFTRPECYIMSLNGGSKAVLSEQAEHDTDFMSCYSRMPYILDLLSPIYVTGSYSQNDINSNWNYLLSNRVISISAATSMQIGTMDNVQKSTTGFTVTPAGITKSDQGSTIQVVFQDTKDFAVYEMMRMWILYMHKIKRGIFTPSYNGYRYRNEFLSPTKVQNLPGAGCIYHPYDRALDYGCSMFDIITNESDTKILYWWKYYGLYPTEVTLDGLSNDKGGPITSDNMTCTVTFKYHYRLANDNKSLMEFNYNAGITDDMGRVNKKVLKASYPFMLKNDDSKVLSKYIGASSMFTGSPYIIMGESQKDPLDSSKMMISPYLQFLPLNEGELNSNINLGITNVRDNDVGAPVGTLYQEGGTSKSPEQQTVGSNNEYVPTVTGDIVTDSYINLGQTIIGAGNTYKDMVSHLADRYENNASEAWSDLKNDLGGGFDKVGDAWDNLKSDLIDFFKK